MPTRIIVVRHGETEWNKAGRQQGHLDSPLTALGIRQAEALAAGLRQRRIDAFYCSDLGRAVQTAAIISHAVARPFETDPALRERNLGILQGLTKEEFAQRFPHEAARFEDNHPEYALPDGESARQLYTRCVECAERIAGRHDGQTVLIVAHSGVLVCYLHRALNLPLDRPRTYSLFNACLNVFTVSADRQWRLDVWGETAHLQGRKLEVTDYD
jgi:probable phosphoglycerate mutase